MTAHAEIGRLNERVSELERENTRAWQEFRDLSVRGGKAVSELQDRLARTLDALRQIQWGNPEIQTYGGGISVFNLCPMCDQVEKNGHAPDCLVGLALEGK
jgi:hypothetical protein